MRPFLLFLQTSWVFALRETWGYGYQPFPHCSYSSTHNNKSGYTEYGPYCWQMHDSACSGSNQSPINLHGAVPTAPGEFEPLKFTSTSCKSAAFFNSGRAWEVSFEGSCPEYFEVDFNGKAYALESLVLHSPSEHTVGGARYDMEMQLVHKSHSHETLILAILFAATDQQETENAFLNIIEGGMGADPYTGIVYNKTANWTAIGTIHDTYTISQDLDVYARVVPGKPTYYTYKGSLTHPPCTEEVQWVVMSQPLRMSMSQVQSFRSSLSEVNNQTSNIHSSGHYTNSRPVQPINGRTVYFFSGAGEGHGEEEDGEEEEKDIFFGSILLPIVYLVNCVGLVVIAGAGVMFAASVLWVHGRSWSEYFIPGSIASSSRVRITTFNIARYRFLKSLVLILEVLVAADVIEILVTPIVASSWNNIGKIGVVVVIRTAMSFQLGHEFEALQERCKEEKEKLREMANPKMTRPKTA